MTYQQLLKQSQTAALYDIINCLLGWDQETYMPLEAIEIRSMQIERIADLRHKEKTSKKFSRMLGKLIDIETGVIIGEGLTAAQCAALREWRRDYIQSAKLPSSFVRKFAQVSSASMHAWKIAKETNCFSTFLPHLKKIVTLCRKKTDILGFSAHPYDALIDLFEPETKTVALDLLFNQLKNPLCTLVKHISSKPKPNASFLQLPYCQSKQLEFGNKLLAAMGFDRPFFRLDQSAHPMCCGNHPNDVRMTTRIYPENPMPNIFSVIHEGGHALYTRFLPKEEFGSPLCEPVSYGINESQSRLWETIIGHSMFFWEHFYPQLQSIFPTQLNSITLEEFYRAINFVQPSLIRIDADEVTYNLHIMLRFELEKSLIEGTLLPEDLPNAWDEKMTQLIGITPSSAKEGCLQDIHWSMGAIGYFPTYTLGNLYAAQFFAAFAEKHPHWQEQIKVGGFSPLRCWLNQEIHRFGRQYTPEELCIKVTNKPLSEKPFLNYLQQKYQALYP